MVRFRRQRGRENPIMEGNFKFNSKNFRHSSPRPCLLLNDGKKKLEKPTIKSRACVPLGAFTSRYRMFLVNSVAFDAERLKLC